MQALQLITRLDAKLAYQPVAQVPEHLQRLSLPAAAVPGGHEHPGQPLCERVPGQHEGNLRRGLCVPASCQQTAEPVLDC